MQERADDAARLDRTPALAPCDAELQKSVRGARLILDNAVSSSSCPTGSVRADPSRDQPIGLTAIRRDRRPRVPVARLAPPSPSSGRACGGLDCVWRRTRCSRRCGLNFASADAATLLGAGAADVPDGIGSRRGPRFRSWRSRPCSLDQACSGGRRCSPLIMALSSDTLLPSRSFRQHRSSAEATASSVAAVFARR